MTSNRMLVIAAHPDDEVLGCGGTIAKYAQRGTEVHVVIMAEGVTSRDRQRDQGKRAAEIEELGHAAREANRILGVTELRLEAYPDNRMDSVELLEIVKSIEEHVERVRPSIVLTHHVGDVNIDHRRIHQAVVTACRPLPGFCVKTLSFFEIPSSTEWQTPAAGTAFLPTWFEDITDTWELKREALEAYASEMRPGPHARSVLAVEYLARWRGASVGTEAAEAFMLGRRIGR